MRILIHDFAGHPFPVQLSRELARRGFEVFHLYFGYNLTPKGNLRSKETDPAGLKIEGVYTRDSYNKYSFFTRWRQEVEYGKLMSERIRLIRPDVVVSAQTPLDSQKEILRICKKYNVRFIYWLQDVLGIAAQKLLRDKYSYLGSLIGKYHIRLEQNMLRESDHVVLIAEDFQTIIEGWGISQEKISVIPNWAPLDEIPVRNKVNHWSVENRLDKKYCFLYSGSMGLKHNPELLLQLAEHYKNNEHISVVVISEGLGAQWLREQKDSLSLDNLILQGYQDYSEMSEVLGTADTLMAILTSEAGEFSVPSKVLTYMCANRPILLSIPNDNLVARIIVENHLGFVVPPLDNPGFIQAADDLVENPKLSKTFGSNARAYAEEHFNIEKIADSFEGIIRPKLTRSAD
jgi:glycosyltransferase involved in cell wall biosynthesis